MTVTTNLPQDDPATALVVERVFFELRKVIVGQSRLIERMLVGLLSQGHCLLESVPGLAKTLAAETLSKVVGGTFGRVQFTPDLLPSDIVGTRIFRSSSEKFDVELGPVFVNFLLADEINRAPAKVQSALLEVMAEQHVTIGGNTYDVPAPVLRHRHAEPDRVRGRVPTARSTARPVHDEDHDDPSVGRRGDDDRRSDERVRLPCPSRSSISRDWPTCRSERRGCSSIAACSSTPSISCRRRARPAQAGMADLAPVIALGASPRASLALVRGAKALALLRGRTYATPQEIFDLAPEILRHRLILTYDALSRDISIEQVLSRVLSTVPTMWVSPKPNDGALAELRVPTPSVMSTSTIEWPSGPTACRRRRVVEIVGVRDQPPARRPAARSAPGHHTGHGSEPGESRTYQPGDDVRRIDWNVTARTRELHVRDQIADRDLEAWIVVDVSAAMHFGTKESTKAQIALAAAATVGFLTARNQNRVGCRAGRRPAPAHHAAAARPRQRACHPAGRCRFAPTPRASAAATFPRRCAESAR